MMDNLQITFEESPEPADVEVVHGGLRAYNRQQIGYEDARRLVLLVRNKSGRIVGGVLGYTYWGWLSIDILWLDETMRRTGLGSRLLREAETEAVARGCRQAMLDTMDFQAPTFYPRHGYEIYAVLDGFAGDHKRFYFRKQLA
jgi:GNAT superfamily N-acetyltransferase